MDDQVRRDLFDRLHAILSSFAGVLEEERSAGKYSLSTTKPIVVDEKLREGGYYFAGLREQKNIVGFYFMPLHVCPELIEKIPWSLQKLLKGKTCFNMRKLTPEMAADIPVLMELGIDTYRNNGWI